ncbi:BESS domain-containing protein [Aphis craccivora]|uniref:BESS domain-containing protein n=1 Tax=Aphis craccivora TaxID=307492 RepID=A0A6G0YM66_APHCR|nr:BESS domain-containing protein [Aphis craccivora]
MFLQNLQRKWKSLRNSFAREQAKRKTLKSGLGSKSWKTYVYFNQLSFLSTCVGNKLTTSNLSPIYYDDELNADTETVTDNEENDKVNDSDEEHRYEDTIIQSRPSKKQKTQHKDSETQLFMSIQQSLEQRNQMTKSMDDPDRLFLLSLIDDLKQVPADKKMEVKLSIMQTISNAKKYRQQNIPSNIPVGSNVDTQFSSNSIHTPIINQYSDLY